MVEYVKSKKFYFIHNGLFKNGIRALYWKNNFLEKLFCTPLSVDISLASKGECQVWALLLYLGFSATYSIL